MQSVLRSYSFPHYGWRRRDSRRREISPANPHRGGTAPASHLNQHPWWGDPQCHLVSVSFCSAISLGFFRSVLELRAIIINDTFFVTDQAASSQILSLPCLVILLNNQSTGKHSSRCENVQPFIPTALIEGWHHSVKRSTCWPACIGTTFWFLPVETALGSGWFPQQEQQHHPLKFPPVADERGPSWCLSPRWPRREVPLGGMGLF